MRKIILFVIFSIVLIALFANPAPVSFEIEDLFLVFLPCFLAIVCLLSTIENTTHRIDNHLLLAIMLYLSYLLLSIWIGLLQGVNLLNVLRAIGPYLNFFPLLFICLLPMRLISPIAIGMILVSVGFMQACYEIYLYLKYSSHVINTLDVLKNRITLIDPRTTLPIVLATTILPIAFIFHKIAEQKKSHCLNLLGILVVLLSLLGGAVTLTRAIVLSIFVGWLVFLTMYLYQQFHLKKLNTTRLFKKLLIYGALLACLIIIISHIQQFQMILQGLSARFNHSLPYATSSDYSNGRIYDEWLPALNTWMNSDLLNIFFGIGAGNVFTVASGEERSYIHNLSIYSLVYGGFFGFLACLWLYLTTFRILIHRALQTQQTIYIGFAALLASLFFYGQLFAVHKGLAFNAMLFLIIAIALPKPTDQFSRQANMENQ